MWWSPGQNKSKWKKKCIQIRKEVNSPLLQTTDSYTQKPQDLFLNTIAYAHKNIKKWFSLYPACLVAFKGEVHQISSNCPRTKLASIIFLSHIWRCGHKVVTRPYPTYSLPVYFWTSHCLKTTWKRWMQPSRIENWRYMKCYTLTSSFQSLKD